MIKKKLILFLTVLILLSPALVQSATISGTVYNIFLEELDKAIITVDTTPEQTVVSKQGTYSLSILPGEYTLIAIYEKAGEIYKTKETITIAQEGNYTIDLILIPDLEDEIIIEEEVLEFEPKVSKTITIITAIVIILLLVYLALSKKHFIKEEDIKTETEEDLENLVKFIKEKGGRITQKDIRKKFPLSEAKISLMITELESKKIIRKIKKGRGNVIILN